jgi:copper ion binding protein
MKKLIIEVEGMSCAHCKRALEEAIGRLEGVRSVAVDLGKNQAVVEAEEDMLDTIRRTIDEAGYTAK